MQGPSGDSGTHFVPKRRQPSGRWRAPRVPPHARAPRVSQGAAPGRRRGLLQDRADGEQDVPRLEAGDGPWEAVIPGDELVGFCTDDGAHMARIEEAADGD